LLKGYRRGKSYLGRFDQFEILRLVFVLYLI
jgi:hypothetical protein